MKAKYYIYRNVTKNTFSIRHRGKVIDHAETILAKNAHFSVSETGRQKVLRTRQKNVHAYVVCESYVQIKMVRTRRLTEVTYNPYKQKEFESNGKSVAEKHFV